MDEEEKAQAAAKRDAFLREMERKSLDTIMVYNPTSEDYLLEWDRRYHRIPSKDRDLGFGKGKMELSRYLAEKYAREMKNLIVNIASDKFMKEFRKEREQKGERFRDKHEENEEAIALVPKTSDPERIRQAYNMIILGVVREYGMELPDDMPKHVLDEKTPEERALENMNKPYDPSGIGTQEEGAPEETVGIATILTAPEEAPKSVKTTPKKAVAEVSL